MKIKIYNQSELLFEGNLESFPAVGTELTFPNRPKSFIVQNTKWVFLKNGTAEVIIDVEVSELTNF